MLDLRRYRAQFFAADAYAVNGFSPASVFDFSSDYYRTSGTASTFADALTFSRAGLATMVDSDGLLKWAPHNMLTWSESFGNAAWTKSGGGTGTAPIVTENFAAAPDGSITADRVQFSQGLGTSSGDYSLILRTTSLSAALYTDGLWIRSNTGENQTLLAYNTGNGVGIEWTVTPDWTLVKLADSDYADSNYSSGVPILVFGLRGGGGARYFNGTNTPQTADVLVWGGHLYRSDLGGMVNNPTTGNSYVPTQGSPVYLPRAGHHVYEGGEWVNKGLLLESAAATNLFLNSNLSNVITVTSGATYTASVHGSGTVTVNGVGSATSDAPLTFVAPSSSITVTKSVQADIAQIEVGAIATSPIPTTASQATRASETLTPSDLTFDAATMWLTLDGSENYADLGIAGQVTLFDWRADASNRITIYLDTDGTKTGNVKMDVVSGGVTYSVSQAGLSPSEPDFKIAARITSGEINLAVNGMAATAVPAGALPDLSAATATLGGNGTRLVLRQGVGDIGDTGIVGATA